MSIENTDIFISGGGLAGLLASIAFGQAGFQVVCVDPAAPVSAPYQPGADLRTTAFLQPARDFLEDIGLWSAFAPSATPLEIMRIVDASADEALVRDFVASDISDRAFAWNLPNWLLRRECLARIATLPNISFRPHVATRSFLTRNREARIQLSDGTTISADLAIAADGRNSLLRDLAGISVRTTRFGQKALSFAVTHSLPHENISTEIHLQGGPFTFVPLPDQDERPCSAVIWMETGPEAKRLAGLNNTDFEAAANARSTGILGPLKLASPRSVWPIISQVADRFSGERLALIAEAAHVVPPIGAQGLNMSLADVSALLELAKTNSASLGSTEMLDKFQNMRQREVRLKVSGITALNRTSMAGSAAAMHARSMGLRALHAVTPIRKSLMQLGLGATR